MAKNKRKTQEILLIHSRAKVTLLQTYLKRYLPIIQNSGHADRITVMDLFCSEGVYKNKGKGSPIITLECIRDVQNDHSDKIKKWTPMLVIFNDYDRSKIEKLKGHVVALELDELPGVQVEYKEKDYKEIVTLLPNYMKRNPRSEHFIFIDPYGYKEINATEIRDLINTGNSEVLLFQPVTDQYRFINSGTPAVLEEFVQNVIPNSSREFQSAFEFVDAIKKGFREFMGKKTFVDSFTIERDSGTVYALYFFSQHIRGFEKMLEAKWELDQEEGKGWSYNQTFDLFSKDIKENELEKKLIEYLSKRRSNVEIYEFILYQGYLPKHATEVLRNLQAKGRLTAVNTEGKPIRKNSFYVSYEYRKQHNHKAFFNV